MERQRHERNWMRQREREDEERRRIRAQELRELREALRGVDLSKNPLEYPDVHKKKKWYKNLFTGIFKLFFGHISKNYIFKILIVQIF
jgi:hypothetical protein